MDVFIRNERPEDHFAVENLTREAFWNLHVPGCNEHLLAHVLRGSPDFLPELDFVAEADGRIVGNIMFTRSRVVGADGAGRDTVTFGPVSVLPECQKRGVGRALIERGLALARAAGHRAVIISATRSNSGRKSPEARSCRAARCSLQPGTCRFQKASRVSASTAMTSSGRSLRMMNSIRAPLP